MKSLLLAAIALVTAGGVQAQMFEGSIGGGISTVGKPKGLPSVYQGSKSVVNPSVTAQFHYNLSDYWQIGGSISSQEMTRTGNWSNTSPFGQPSVNKNVTFVIANPAISFNVRVNRMIPFYSSYNPELVQSAIYFGASAGAIFTSNDGKTITSSDGYVKDFDLENGKGYTIGIHGGYTYYYKRHIAVFGELEPMFAQVYTSDARDAHNLEQYHMIYLNVNIGLRYRWGYY
jgi:hypothetical protein